MFKKVLNLIISGMPSILRNEKRKCFRSNVLNLIISGMPSIPLILLEY